MSSENAPGAVLRAARLAAGLTQRELAARAGYSRSSVANAERGEQRSAGFFARCEAVLQVGVPAPVQADGVQSDAGHRDDAVQGDAVGQSDAGEAPVEEQIEHLRQVWHTTVRTDNLLGPAVALPAAGQRMENVRALLDGAAGPSRSALLCLAARYAETLAWLCQDAGRHTAAVAWSVEALERAHEVGDPRLLAWALFRRSQLALASGATGQAAGLAAAAARQVTSPPGPMRAALLQQQAHCLAAAGDELGSLRRLAEARAAAGPDVTGDARNGYGGFCTPEFLDVQLGVCLLRLGQAPRAVSVLAKAVAALPPVYHRDRGLALTHLAAAHQQAGEVEAAATAALAGLRIGAATGSVRTGQAARALAVELAGHRAVPAVAALLSSASGPAATSRPSTRRSRSGPT